MGKLLDSVTKHVVEANDETAALFSELDAERIAALPWMGSLHALMEDAADDLRALDASVEFKNGLWLTLQLSSGRRTLKIEARYAPVHKRGFHLSTEIFSASGVDDDAQLHAMTPEEAFEQIGRVIGRFIAGAKIER